jgi:uncharacterized protein YjeT (DUF2065 family)
MGWILLIIGLLYVAVGSGFILATSETREVMRGLVEKLDRRLLAAIAIVFSILLLAAAGSSRHPWFFRLLGLLGLLKGGFIFADPNGAWQRVCNWYFNTIKDQDLRAYGIATVVLGTVMVAWIL